MHLVVFLSTESRHVSVCCGVLMGQSFQGEGPPLTPIKDSSYKGAGDKIAASTLRQADEARARKEERNTRV